MADEDDVGWDLSIATTVTIAVDDGPTVHLTYDGGGARGSVLPHMRVEARNQATTPAPRWVYQLLGTAAMLLLLYARYGINEKDRPPDRPPASRQTDND
jgi:hypothetical protein